MSSGARGIVIACLAGLAVVSVSGGFYWAALSYPEEQRYQPYRFAFDKPQEIDRALEPQANPETIKYRVPCHDPKGRDESELCAAWRSARAGEDSATWAKWGFGATVIGIFGLLASITQGRIALERAREANKIARDGLAEARELSIHELRAYIEVKAVEVREVEDPNQPFALLLTYENQGATPALNVHTQFRTKPVAGLSAFDFEVDPPPKMANGSLGRLASGVLRYNSCPLGGNATTEEVMGDIVDGTLIIFGIGWIAYEDVFGIARKTNFKWYLDQSCLQKGMAMQIFRDGNDAT